MPLILDKNDPNYDWLMRWDKATPEDRKRMQWARDWKRTKDIEKEFLLLIFPEITNKDKATLRPLDRCIISAMSRAIKDNLIENNTCSRCNGSGHYSWNQIDGSTCYGCRGTGIQRPKVTKQLIKQIKINSEVKE